MGPKILLIDDEPDEIEFSRRYLCRRGYEVITATNTPEAVEALQKESPDIVFCDVRLETDTAGLDILEIAKKCQPDIVVYLITGILDREIEAEGLRRGAKEVLHKPLSNEVLEQKIKEGIPPGR